MRRRQRWLLQLTRSSSLCPVCVCWQPVDVASASFNSVVISQWLIHTSHRTFPENRSRSIYRQLRDKLVDKTWYRLLKLLFSELHFPFLNFPGPFTLTTRDKGGWESSKLVDKSWYPLSKLFAILRKAFHFHHFQIDGAKLTMSDEEGRVFLFFQLATDAVTSQSSAIDVK